MDGSPVRKIVRKCLEANRASRDAAVDAAYAELIAHPQFQGWQEFIIKTGIRALANTAQHKDNVSLRIRKPSEGSRVGGMGARASVAAKSLLDTYTIGGFVLGDIQGNQLAELAQNERAKAEGCLINARLCEWLASKVTGDKVVRNFVKEPQVEKALRNIQGYVATTESRMAGA